VDATSIIWFRRDLRLEDLPALAAAAAAARSVVPVFVVDPAFTRSGVPRRAYLRARLTELNRAMDGALVYRHGDPVDVIPALAAEVGAATVHVTRDHAPYGRRRDAAVAERLRVDGRHLVGTGSNYAVTPGSVVKADGTPYAVFTPFSKAWRVQGWDAPVEVDPVSWRGAPDIACDGPPAAFDTDVELPAVGGDDVDAQWDAFRRDRLADYPDRRNAPAVDGTSRLSAALRWGVVHPRRLLAEIDHDDRHRVFANELAWREFYADVLFHRPESAWRNVDRRMDALVVDDGPEARALFDRWASGATGYPIVDAGMRQLLATGYMHNRVRMIVASFLTKDLHLPWQWGARHFMAHLVDGDLASNAHGWQWTAGTGTDAAPYFRVFNPTGQAERFDPEGDYVRRWVPELVDLPAAVIHAPGIHRPDTYPPPMVDHVAERAEALARYQRSRGR
jgi:deoxyribodipyrimidine photo-lyase